MAARARAEEARAAASREGLELVPSNNACGFKGVYRDGRKFEAYVREGGKERYLGLFGTPEEAALAYARHVGIERAAREAAKARGEWPWQRAAEEAKAAAQREGLELVPADTPSGFKGVDRNSGKFAAQLREDGKLRYLGKFDTAEAAALAYARHVGIERVAREAASAEDGDGDGGGGGVSSPAEPPAAAAPSRDAAAPSASSPTADAEPQRPAAEGLLVEFECRQCAKRYQSKDAVRKHCRNNHRQWLTAIGQGDPSLYCVEVPPKPATAASSSAAAASSSTARHRAADGKFAAQLREDGNFDTAEAAALAYARHIGKERAAAARGEGPAASREGPELVPADTAKRRAPPPAAADPRRILLPALKARQDQQSAGSSSAHAAMPPPPPRPPQPSRKRPAPDTVPELCVPQLARDAQRAIAPSLVTHDREAGSAKRHQTREPPPQPPDDEPEICHACYDDDLDCKEGDGWCRVPCCHKPFHVGCLSAASQPSARTRI